MQNFSEERFPTDISYGATGGPLFCTEIIESASGYEHRNIRSIQARHRYNLNSSIRNEEQMEKVIAFFKAMKGKAIGFRYKDWLDYKAEKQIIGVCDGKQKNFQLIKSYITGAIKENRKISKPVNNTVTIYIDNEKVKEFEVDYETGLVTLDHALGANKLIKASFEFDVPVRFDIDYLPITMQNFSVHMIEEVSLIEIIL